MRTCFILAAASCAALAGCTSMNLQGDASPDDRVFVTGSHLPSKAGSGTASVKTLAPPPFDQTVHTQTCGGGPICSGAQ